MRFIEVADKQVNIDHIARVWVTVTKGTTKDHTAHVIMSDGSEFSGRVYAGTAETIMSLAFKDDVLVPANPGFFLLWYWFDEKEGESVHRHELIAWKISDEPQFKVGIGVFGSSDEEHAAVLCPSGKVAVLGETIYDNEEKWLESEREKFKKKIA